MQGIFDQGIFNYVSEGDLWGLLILAVMIAIIAANCSYQSQRKLVRDRVPRGARVNRQDTPAGGFPARAWRRLS